MTFGSKRLDNAYDQWATQTPDDYFGVQEDDEEITAQELIDQVKKKKKINLHPKKRCPKCKMLYYRKHKCQRKEK